MSASGDDRTLGAGRRRDHLRLGVDFGTVCRRCGARLLDEAVVTVWLGYRQDVVVGVAPTLEAYEHRVPLCEQCWFLVWRPTSERFHETLDPEKRTAQADPAVSDEVVP